MSGNEPAAAACCMRCGKGLIGPFCAYCGTKAPEPGEGWTSVAAELFDAESSRTHRAALGSFLKAPVLTIIALTEDASYRTHWAFLSACLAAQFALGFLILPKLLGSYYAVPDLGGKASVITNQIVQYAGIAVLTPVQYYLCRFTGTIKRSPASYVKLCVLSVSFCAIVGIAITLAFWAIGIASTRLGTPLEAGTNGTVLTLLAQVAIVAFVTIVHKRFWGMKWWVATLVTLLIAFLSWGVVYPLLTDLTARSGLVQIIDDLLP